MVPQGKQIKGISNLLAIAGGIYKKLGWWIDKSIAKIGIFRISIEITYINKYSFRFQYLRLKWYNLQLRQL